MINIIIDRNLLNKNQAIYSFYYLLERYNDKLSFSYVNEKECINIYYGVLPQTSGNIYIPVEDEADNKIAYNLYNNDTYYLSFKNQITEPFYVKNNNIYFKFDIVFTSFYLISCMEEYQINERDGMERFLAANSKRKEKIDIPFFDNNSKILYNAIKLLNKEYELKQKEFQIMLTHDVDNVNSRNKYVFIHNMSEILLNKGYHSIGYKLINSINDIFSNRHKQIQNIINIEKQYNAKSEFYFIQGYKHRLGRRYNMKEICEDIDFIKNHSECVIGLHTNYFSYNDESQIKEEIESIEKNTLTKVVSGRNHYLRFKVPDTWLKLHSSGIKCDCTLGYSDINGFRAGTANYFIPFDLNTNNIIDISEVPLIVMDGIIMEENINFDEKWIKIKNLLDKVIEHLGTSSILFHERLICYEDYRNMYIKILNYIEKKGGKFITSKEVIEKTETQKKELECLFTQT